MGDEGQIELIICQRSYCCETGILDNTINADKKKIWGLPIGWIC